MTKTWERLGPIAWGGSVLSIRAGALGQTWCATGGAIWVRGDAGWQPLRDPVPLQQVGLVGAAGNDWFTAGLTGGLVLTWDRGRFWATPWIDQVAQPITCFVTSPRYAIDHTLLAGTNGAGVLRSTDGGRRWLLSNFGLREYTVLALASAGDWSRREVVFAGTLDGVYRSSGGGRAWKPAGLAGTAVQALAIGTTAERVILAGTEEAGLSRSTDGGMTWQPAGEELGREVSVNALYCFEAGEGQVWLAGTADGRIWRSTGDGDAWTLACEVEGPVLALAVGSDGRLLWAGTSEQGILVSADLGRSWQVDRTLCAWNFRGFLRGTDDRNLLALTPTGGVWCSEDGGSRWERLASASLYEPILAYAIIGNASLIARADGLWRSDRGGEPRLVLEPAAAPINALAVDRGSQVAWAGAADGALWVSRDGGLGWQALDTPLAGQQLVALAVTAEDATLLAGTFSAGRRETTLWRLRDGRWQRWLSRAETWPGMALAAGGRRGETTWAALGGKAWAHTGAGWREVKLAGHDGAVVAITPPAAGGVRYVIAGQEVLRGDAGGSWVALPLPASQPDAANPLDLHLTASGELLCLDAAGVIWRWAA